MPPTENSQPTQAAAKREVKNNVSDKAFLICLGVITVITIPFLYFANAIYQYSHDNKPKGYKLPEYKQLWMTVVGAVCFGVFKEMIYAVAIPFFKWAVVNKGDDYAWNRKVEKAAKCTVGFFYFSLSTFWGWSMMK